MIHGDKLEAAQREFRVVHFCALDHRFARLVVADVPRFCVGKDARIERERIFRFAAGFARKEKNGANLLLYLVGFKIAELPVEAEPVGQPDIPLAERVFPERHEHGCAVF